MSKTKILYVEDEPFLGKIVKERDYQNLKKDTITLDVNDVPNGVYNIQIQTIGNFRTMRFVKAN